MPRVIDARMSLATPLSETFALLADVGNEAAWNPDVKSVRRVTDGPLEVGTEWVGDYRGMGSMRVQLIEYVPDRRLTFTTTGSRLDMVFTFEFSERADGGTYAGVHAELTPHGGMRLVGPLVVPMMRRTLAKRPAQIEIGVRRQQLASP